MDQTLLIVIVVFVIVSAVAMCIQVGMLIAMFGAVRRLEATITPMLPKINALIESSQAVVEDSKKQIHDITAKTNEILDITRKQLTRVDEVLEDAAMRARVQLDRAEMVIDDAMHRAQETVAMVHQGVMTPIREIQGVAAGIRAGLNFLMRGRRDGPLHATADEEMFI